MSDDKKKPQEIFFQAIEIESAKEQKAFLVRACEGNDELRAKVDGLIRAYHAAGSFLEEPIAKIDEKKPSEFWDAANATQDETTDSGNTEGNLATIGPYKLLQRIGEGGMGTVYMAQQEKPVKRRVALKIIKQGMDTKQVVARFEAERQALSMMDHPSIAQVLDVGATEHGRPFFVMELIKGLPITHYCDKENMNIKQRLELFQTVCSAVQHAHQKGIIHRDIKPTNVLVAEYDGKPVAKIIDFGLAKALHQELTDKTMFTQLGQVVGTLEYMSPEQSSMNQLEVDTRTDIYSLGVLLYELLTGTTPFDKQRMRSAALDQILKMIREEEPPKPSLRLSTVESSVEAASHRGVEPKRLGLMLRGDLDWIVMKALDKDRNRRYATPNDLATDIERHLKIEPIQARPVSAWERHWRWCRRNPVVSSLAAILMFSIVAGFVGVASQWRRADNLAKLETRARKNAEQQSSRADAEADLARRRAEEARLAAERAHASAEQAGDYLYATRMILAQRALEDGQLGEVAQLLKVTTPNEGDKDRRGLEWTYLSRGCNSFLAKFEMDKSFTNDLAYSPDGRLLAAVADGHVKVWSVHNKKLLHRFRLRGRGECVAFSPDGKHLVSAEAIGNQGTQTTVKAWNIETGAEKTIAKCMGTARELSFSPDGERVVAAVAFSFFRFLISRGKQVGYGGIKVWNFEDGAELLSIDFTMPRLKDYRKMIATAFETQAIRFAYSPDGNRLAGVMGRGTVKVWDAETGEQLLELSGGFGNIVFSSDGKRIISAGTTWNVADGTVVSRRPNARPWTACHGQRAALADRGIVTVFDIETHRVAATLPGTGGGAMALSPDGWRLATAASRDIRIWDTQGRQESLTLTHPTTRNSPPGASNSVSNAAISPDGHRVATVIGGGFSSTEIRIWDRITGRVLVEIKIEKASGLRFSCDGSQLAASYGYDKGTNIWDSRTGDLLHQFEGRFATFSPDGGMIATVHEQDKQAPVVKIWDSRTGDLLHQFEGRFATFSPDGGTIATIHEQDKQATVVLHDASTGDKTGGLDIEWNSIDRLAYHPSGRQLAVQGRRIDGRRVRERKEPDVIAICDVSDGRVIASHIGPDEGLRFMAFSPNGETLAVASSAAVYLLDPHTMEETTKLDERANRLVFSPDGGRLLISSQDRISRPGMIRVLDVDSWQEVLRLRGAWSGLSFDAGGNFLVAGGQDEGLPRAAAVAKVWDLRRVGSDIQVELEAMGLVRYLASQQLKAEEVEQRIRNDRTISTAARQQALKLWAECWQRLLSVSPSARPRSDSRDKDLKLIQAETKQMRRPPSEADADKNGSTSKAELAGSLSGANRSSNNSQETDDGKRLRENRPSSISRPQPNYMKYEKYAESLIKRYDEDKDGKLSREETKKMRRPPSGADVDKDGFITETELVGSLDGANRSSGSSPKIDNSKPPKSARSPELRGQAKLEKYVDSLLNQYDEDKDGQLSRDEQKKMRRPPTGADSNNDGKVSRNELIDSLSGKSTNSPNKKSKPSPGNGQTENAGF